MTARAARFTLTGAVALLVAITVSIVAPQTAHAAYEAGRLIDDGVFLDAQSMDKDRIQTFLENKESGLKDLSFVLQCYGPDSTERQWYTAAGATCDTPIPASHIIYYASQIYGVNPKVILATMQKEQSLTTAQNPTSWQLNQAMGYACPTSGSCGGNSSFPYQIDAGTWALRYHFERARGNMTWWSTSSSWTCGTEKNLYKPNLYPRQNVNFYDTNGTHYTTVYIHSSATSALYCYTPHAYNNPQGLFGRDPYGTTGLYYSGSYNFVLFFEQWFGSTRGDIFAPLETPRWMRVKNDDTYKVDVITQEQVGGALSANRQIKFVDKTKINGKWYLRTEFNHNDGGLYAILQDELEEIPYEPIAPKWVTFIEDGNRSHPASRTTVGDHLIRGTSVKVVDRIAIDGNIYYRTEYNHENNQDAGIHSRFVTDFEPIPLEGPRNFCSPTTLSKIDPRDGQNTATTDKGIFMINKKTFINSVWFFQADVDNDTPIFFDSRSLSDTCYLPFEGARSMRLNQDATRFNPVTGVVYDTLPKSMVIPLSTKIFLNGQWYFRTAFNTQNNTDAVILASSFSEL